MSTVSAYDYIFTESCAPIGGGNRWSWMDCLVSDLRLFLNGIEANNGGGNLTLPIPVCTGVDLVSDLWAGDTDYLHCRRSGCTCTLDHSSFNQTDVACGFVTQYFRGPVRQIPHILWDCVRNGLTHCFMPKTLTDAGHVVRFSFTAGGVAEPCAIQTLGAVTVIRINVHDLVDALEIALQTYRADLASDPVLQANFRRAWESLEAQSRQAHGDYQTELNLVRTLAAPVGLFDPGAAL
ncbi:MAG: hypothetical protein KKI08_19565 [Armatimonadetes bacterium]|nr:hypothetical protein [Armatimonadota bacterium]